jgi:hypothetical protein
MHGDLFQGQADGGLFHWSNHSREFHVSKLNYNTLFPYTTCKFKLDVYGYYPAFEYLD